MTRTAADLISVAAGQVGFKEGPNNDTPYGAWYGLNHNPYCDMGVSWCADQTGMTDIVGHFAYCPSHVNWFRGRGQWGTEPRRGAIVFYSWDHGPSADHVGIVEAVLTDGRIQTIEFNTSSGQAGSQSNGDGVYRRVRATTYVLGYGYPAYDGAESTQAASPVPPALVQPPSSDWDGHSFPGVQVFRIGNTHPAITLLGERLVAHGFGGAYKQGPGPTFGQADKTNCAAFQRSQGWSGGDADGYPGQETWNRLMADNPAPTPAPASQEPPTQGDHGGVYMSKMHVGQTDSDSVRCLQRALRDYPNISTIPLNPSGVTGTYGSETAAMVELVYRTFDQWQPGHGWGDGDLSTPGRSLLAKLGLRILG